MIGSPSCPRPGFLLVPAAGPAGHGEAVERCRWRSLDPPAGRTGVRQCPPTPAAAPRPGFGRSTMVSSACIQRGTGGRPHDPAPVPGQFAPTGTKLFNLQLRTCLRYRPCRRRRQHRQHVRPASGPASRLGEAGCGGPAIVNLRQKPGGARGAGTAGGHPRPGQVLASAWLCTLLQPGPPWSGHQPTWLGMPRLAMHPWPAPGPGPPPDPSSGPLLSQDRKRHNLHHWGIPRHVPPP